MVKARIGKTEIEGTPEEVAYVLNGLLMAQEEDTEVEVSITGKPLNGMGAGAELSREQLLNSLKPLPPKNTSHPFPRLRAHKNGKRYRWRGKRITYKNILGMTLQDWITKNFPSLSTMPDNGRRSYKQIVKALRAAGVPYNVPKIRLRHSIASATYQLSLNTKAKPAGYTKEEVEEAEEAQQ
jgi:hypothetical protein